MGTIISFIVHIFVIGLILWVGVAISVYGYDYFENRDKKKRAKRAHKELSKKFR